MLQVHSTNKIRLLIVDADTLCREELARFLAVESDFELVAQCSTREQALFLLVHYAVDLVLMDFEPGEDAGLGFSADALATGYLGKTLSVAASIGFIDVAFLDEPGSSGIVLRARSPAHILRAIRLAVRGESGLPKQRMMA